MTLYTLTTPAGVYVFETIQQATKAYVEAKKMFPQESVSVVADVRVRHAYKGTGE